MLNSMLYIEIDVFAALVLLIIIDHSRSNLLSRGQRLFKFLEVTTLCELVLDAIAWALDGSTFAGARPLLMTVEYLYWLATLLPGYAGLLYCASEVSQKLYKRWRFIFAIPTIIGILMLITNPFTGWVFGLDANNVYYRGSHFMLAGLLPFICIGAAVSISLFHYRRAPINDRQRLLMLSLFMSIPIVGAIIQLLVYGVLTVWIGLTLNILMCYVYIQKGNLSTDALTRINNRGRFDAYTSWKWNELHDDETLSLLIMDIDRFKLINDNFGHDEGDAALVRSANMLKQAMTHRKGFLARIGGDEFAIVLSNADENEVRLLIRDIKAISEKSNAESDAGYRITFSIGHASVLGREKSDFAKLFSEADQSMYEKKRDRKLPDSANMRRTSPASKA